MPRLASTNRTLALAIQHRLVVERGRRRSRTARRTARPAAAGPAGREMAAERPRRRAVGAAHRRGRRPSAVAVRPQRRRRERRGLGLAGQQRESAPWSAGRADTTSPSASGRSPGASSWTLCRKNVRFCSDDRMRSVSPRSKAAPARRARLRGRRAAAPCRARSAAARGTTCRRSTGPCSRVDRVLRRQHHAEAEGARLLHQQQQRLLGRRIRPPAACSRRPRPCRASRAGSTCPTAAHPAHDAG